MNPQIQLRFCSATEIELKLAGGMFEDDDLATIKAGVEGWVLWFRVKPGLAA